MYQRADDRELSTGGGEELDARELSTGGRGSLAAGKQCVDLSAQLTLGMLRSLIRSSGRVLWRSSI